MDKIVDFTYCNTCKHKDLDEANDICHECLNNPTKEDGHIPIKYEEES